MEHAPSELDVRQTGLQEDDESATDIRAVLFLPSLTVSTAKEQAALEKRVRTHLTEVDGEIIDTISFEHISDGPEAHKVFESIEMGDDRNHHLCVIVDLVNEAGDAASRALEVRAKTRGWEYLSAEMLSTDGAAAE